MAKVDPFALTPTSAINKTVNRFVGMYGAPQTSGQIQTQAQGMIDPLIAAITKNAQSEAAASGANIKGLTNSYASELGKLNLAAPYQSATLQQAAVDSALNDTLSNAGSDLASQLRSRLSAIQSDPAVAQTASGLQGMGQAAGGAQVALGSDALSSLLAQGAAAGTYGRTLPGIARLSGIQNIGRVNQQAQSDINTGTQQALSQLPSLVQAMRSDNNSLRANRANAGADLFTTLTGQNVTKATAKAGLGQNAIDNSFKYADTYGYDPATGQPIAGYHKDNNGSIVKDATPKPPKPPKPTGDKALSNSDRRSLLSDLKTWTSGGAPKKVFNSKTQEWMNTPGTGSKALPYAQVVQNLMTSYGLSQAEAEKYANSRYQSGQHGRPYPVAPPKGAEPLSPTSVIKPNGDIFKLAGGKWIQQTSKPNPAGTTMKDANGDTFTWNGSEWVKK